ncbi:MAG: bifunctional riboflavin kinase/FAD synthetase [Hyphomicrobiaceae bacterium]
MHIIRGHTGIASAWRGAVLAIGNFDGVHRGHQGLLAEVKTRAREFGTHAGVITFEPHPREFFAPDRSHFRLTPLPLKLDLMARSGLDLAVVLTFDGGLAGLDPHGFIARILVEALGIRHVAIGYDFRFGKGRSGDADMLQAAGRQYGFGVGVMAPLAADGEIFSSSAIRARLAQGDVQGAAQALGYWWRVVGTVTGGAKRGSGLGFPTANIVLPEGTALAHGIYAARVRIGDGRYSGAAYFGNRPTFDGGASVLEVFVFDFADDLYGREMEVAFVDFLRGDRRFDDEAALAVQIAEDCRQTRAALAVIEKDNPLRGLPLGAV